MSSTIPVLAIRPEPGLSATLEAGRKLGLDMHGHPLSEVRPVAWKAPAIDEFDAILLGSANSIRMGGEGLNAVRHLPLYAVGETTAREAKEAGFTVALAGTGGLQAVINQTTPPMRFLRLVGSEYVPLELPKDISFEPVQVYEVVPRAFPDEIAALLGQDAIVLLHSAAMTRQFVSECERLGIDKARITLAPMGTRIIEPVGEGWAAIHIPDRPSDAALLAMVRQLCK